ncbi:MAG TPA: Wzz/FepE/Etk N-terminal domain-containing protein [Micropepsaceae bacterium]|nr:Wzz/FepE/Etk N-terminal domain-containing protein [Micropepsaceae bacterium]
MSPLTAVPDSELPSQWRASDEGDGLTFFFTALRRSWFLILFIVAASVGASVYVVLNMEPYWRAEIVVMPVNRNDPGSLNSTTPAFGALANFVGRQDPLKDEAIAVLRSRELFDTYAKAKNILPILFKRRWDPETNNWNVPAERVPTLREAYRLFDGGIREIDEDRRTGIVTLSITWTDREQAVTWARDMIELANQQLRDRALADSQRNMKYLTDEMRSSPLSSQNALASALTSAYEKQLQNYMFAKGQSEYAFHIIDQPTVPDIRERVSPKRTIIVGAAGAGSLALAILLACARQSLRRRKPVLREV